MSDIKLNVEFASSNNIFGWAFDPAENAGPVEILVPLIGGTKTIQADQFREHLRAAGLGDGHAGFSLQLQAGESIDPRRPLVFRSRMGETAYFFEPALQRALALDSRQHCFLGTVEPIFDCVLVLIIKNEAHYVEEWIEYHRILGVDHFIVFNNGSSDDLQSRLAYYVDLGLVTLFDWPNLERSTEHQRRWAWLEQDTAYACAVRILLHKARWVGFLDVDEFVVFEDRTVRSLGRFLDDCGAPMLFVFWRLFGTSNIEKRTTGLVLEQFTFRAPDLHHRLCKVFVRPESVHSIFNTHRFTSGVDRLNGYTTAGIRSYGYEEILASFNGVTIHHYHTRSAEEFKEKVRRGWPVIDANKSINWEAHFKAYDTNELLDTSAVEFVPELKQRLERSRDARAAQPAMGVDRHWMVSISPALMFHAVAFLEEGMLVIEGYAVDLSVPNEILQLRIHDGYGTLFGEVTCSEPNEFLAMNRVSHAAHGFRFKMPPPANAIDGIMISNARFVRKLKVPVVQTAGDESQ